MEKTWDRRAIDTEIARRNSQFSICDCPIEYHCMSCGKTYNEKDMKETATGTAMCPRKHRSSDIFADGFPVIALLCKHEMSAWSNTIE